MNTNVSHISSRIIQLFSFRKYIICFGEVIALGIVAALSSFYFTTHEAFELTISLATAYLIPRLVFSYGKSRSLFGMWLLLIVGLALAIYTIVSIKSWTVDVEGSFEYPGLKSDDAVYYKWALSHYDGRCPEPKVGFKGISIITAFLWKLFGVSIVWPIALNYMFIMLSIVMTGKLANRLFQDKFEDIDIKNVTVIAMVMVSLLGFLLSQSLRLQKEAACTLGIALVGYALVGMSQELNVSKRTRHKDVALFVLGCLILAFVRTSYAYFAAIGAIMMGLSNQRKEWKLGVVYCLISICITILFSILFSYSFGQQYNTVDGGDPMAKAFKISFEQQPYAAIVGDYFHYPAWKRLLLLPVTTGIQYIIPFPWLYERSEISVFTVLPRFRFMWYFIGGVSVFYYLYLSIVHHKQSHLGMWAWWPLVIFFIIAYITGGIVSRYILPIQPLFVIVALYVLIHFKTGKYRRSFILWIGVYIFFITALLIVCYHIQSDYLTSIKAL